jgi:hypothetical protein
MSYRIYFFYRAGVFEEEDFQPSVYGYNLATMFTDSKASSMLRECEDDFQKKAKLISKAQQNKTQSSVTTSDTVVNKSLDISEESNQHQNELERIDALLGRLKFLRLFHSLILHIWKRDDITECPILIVSCQEALSLLQKTAHLGTQRKCNESGINQ